MLWLLLSGFLLLASSVAYRYLFEIAKLVGVPYPPSALFLLAIAGLTLLIIELFAWGFKPQRPHPHSHATTRHS